MVRARLQVLLGGNDDIEIVVMLADGGEITDTALVDVVLMDTSSPTSTA